MNKNQAKYERIGVYPPEDVLPFCTYNADGTWNHQPEEREYLGQMVKMDSIRYRTFVAKGLKCCVCGIEGTFFALERHIAFSKKQQKANPNGRYHFNLYGIDENGEEVLITKDHIIPVSKGGKDTFKNLQTMCTNCNFEKGANAAIEPKGRTLQGQLAGVYCCG